MESMLLIPEGLRDALLQYLMTRPAGEVMDGILALRALQAAAPPAACGGVTCLLTTPNE